jgi:hypothetical protein
MFGVFPRAHYGKASLKTFTIDAVAARRDERPKALLDGPVVRRLSPGAK